MIPGLAEAAAWPHNAAGKRGAGMNHGLRLAALLACLLGLSGCNLVVSAEPWFSEAEAQPGPRLRDGLWLAAEPDCRVDEAKPAERWPDCASASFVRGDERWSMEWEASDERRGNGRTFAGWRPGSPYDDALFIANGDHLIAQAQTQGEAEAAPSAEVVGATGEAAPRAYMYGALRVLQRDAGGKAVEMESWIVQCGPLPERSSRGRGRRSDDDPPGLLEDNVTDRPFPGLTVVDDNCLAESADAVRQAAVLSEALEPPTRMRWVRRGWR